MSTSQPMFVSEPVDGRDPSALLTEVPTQLNVLLTTIRRHLHMHPEVGLQEHETSQFIRETLEMHGLDVAGPVAHTGLYVDIRGRHPGPMVGYRADIDALPIQDAKQTGYASRAPGVAHLCGHDAHTSVGVGVALLLNRLREHLRGTVRVFFQPNEESSPSGAQLMIKAGVLEGLSAVYAIHVDPSLPSGVFGLRTGAVTAASDRLRIRVKGPTTGHSARPHQSVDTIWVATQILNGLYQLAGRITDARNASVLTICRFQAGEAYNVIPAEVEFGGTLRTINSQDRLTLRETFRQLAQEIGRIHGATVEVTVDQGSPSVKNHPRLVHHVEGIIAERLGSQHVYDIPRPSMGAEDFAHYLEHIPGALIRVGTSAGPDTSHPLHDALFDLDEAALAPTAQLMAHVLLAHLQKGLLD